MTSRHVFVSLALSALLTACSASTPPSPAAPEDAEPASLQGRVLSDANDVADQLNQRNAELEAAIP